MSAELDLLPLVTTHSWGSDLQDRDLPGGREWWGPGEDWLALVRGGLYTDLEWRRGLRLPAI